MAKPLGEFDFIDRFIKAQAALGQPMYRRGDALGIGDDCALMPPLEAGEQLAVSTDMLVEGRHYFSDVDPKALGHKVLAVNLSDLAAMGARPLAFTLAAALRGLDPTWLEAFLSGMLALARDAQCALIGGDTTGMPANGAQVFCVTVMGAVPMGQALRRDGLCDGDDLWVSGSLGDAAFAVQHRRDDPKLLWPAPRIALGLRLRSLAHAAIDISDGLHAEIMHLLRASGGVAAQLDWDSIPLGPRVQQAVREGVLSATQATVIAVTGGDEYELLFSAPPECRTEIRDLAMQQGVALTRIGEVRSAGGPSIHWHHHDGRRVDAGVVEAIGHGGFTHF